VWVAKRRENDEMVKAGLLARTSLKRTAYRLRHTEQTINARAVIILNQILQITVVGFLCVKVARSMDALRKQKLTKAVTLAACLYVLSSLYDSDQILVPRIVDYGLLYELDWQHLRFKSTDLERLCSALGIDDTVRAVNGISFSAREGIIIVLWRLAKGLDFGDMELIVGREWSQISRIFSTMINLIDRLWQHLVTDNLKAFAPRFAAYNNAIRTKYCEWNEVDAMPARFRNVALFTDGTRKPVAKPANLIQGLWPSLQRLVFSGHKVGVVFGSDSSLTSPLNALNSGRTCCVT
jgi:hypothetical protein